MKTNVEIETWKEEVCSEIPNVNFTDNLEELMERFICSENINNKDVLFLKWCDENSPDLEDYKSDENPFENLL